MPNPLTTLQQIATRIQNVQKHRWYIIISNEKWKAACARVAMNFWVLVYVHETEDVEATYTKVTIIHDCKSSIWINPTMDNFYEIDGKISECIDNVAKPIMLFPYLDT